MAHIYINKKPQKPLISRFLRFFFGGEQGIRRAAPFTLASSLTRLCSASPRRVRIPVIKSNKKQKAIPCGIAFFFWRRARDSNPRNGFGRLHDFQLLFFYPELRIYAVSGLFFLPFFTFLEENSISSLSRRIQLSERYNVTPGTGVQFSTVFARPRQQATCRSHLLASRYTTKLPPAAYLPYLLLSGNAAAVQNGARLAGAVLYCFKRRSRKKTTEFILRHKFSGHWSRNTPIFLHLAQKSTAYHSKTEK